MTEDQPARLRALDPAGSFAVRAPAGSGKTTLLTQRVLRLLTTVEHPEQIVAITFTRKAAEEMRTRIVDALKLAAGERPADPFLRQTWELARAVSPHDRANDWQLSEHPARLRVMTIDALCQSLVRQMPITAGMPGLPAVEDDLRLLYREAARDAVAAIVDGGSYRRSIARILQHLDNDWGKLEALLAEMLEKRDQWLPLLAAGSDREVLDRSFERTVNDELAALGACFDAQLALELGAVGAYAGNNLEHSPLAGTDTLPAPQYAYLAVWKAYAGLLLTAEARWRKRVDKRDGFPPAGEHSKAMKGRWAELVQTLSLVPDLRARLGRVQQLPSAAFGAGEWEIVSALVTLLRSATAHLMVLCEQGGRSDFTAFSMAALVALGEPEEPTDLALSLDYQLRHLLIDEFQDTSYTQYELVRRLTAGWSPGDGRTLFLVGDPMQSIYRFRQADVSLFRRVLDDGLIGCVPVEAVTLSANFRAQARLVEWVNTAMPLALATIDVPDNHFVHQRAVRSATAEPCVLHAFAHFDAQSEAARVCEIVASLRAVRPGASVAVLVRSRTHLGQITSALLAAGLAVTAREIQPFKELEVIADLLALAAALLHRADRVAWFALLRAPWCGLSLATLHRLCDLAPTLFDAVAAGARLVEFAADERARMERTHAILGAALADLRRSPFTSVLERAWVALGGPAIARDAQSIDDARAFFDSIAALEREGITLTGERISKRFVERFSAPPSSHDEGVQIMTIHRAKGLEFDCVIIPGLGRPPRGDSRPLLLWREDVDRNGHPNLLFAPIPIKGKSPLYEYLRGRAGTEAEAEVARLLYVALTRAREQIHLLAHIERAADDIPKPAKGALLSLLWPLLERGFSDQQVSHRVPDGSARARPLLRRARTDSLPQVATQSLAAQSSASPVAVEFDWAGVTAKHVGTVTHRLLQDFAGGSNLADVQDWLRRAWPFARGQLRALGIAEDELEGAMASLQQALTTTLGSARGRWLFAAEQREAEAELCLGALEQAEVGRIIIDRTFIDQNECRWIVDFKTGAHTGGALAAYLETEVLRYRPQLERYARVMAQIDPRPIMLGLYFPMLDAWREWPYQPA